MQRVHCCIASTHDNEQNQIHKTELEENLNSSLSFVALAFLSHFMIQLDDNFLSPYTPSKI